MYEEHSDFCAVCCLTSCVLSLEFPRSDSFPGAGDHREVARQQG